MSRSRWQHLDRTAPAPKPRTSDASSESADALVPQATPPEPEHAAIVQARAHYRLRDYHRCAEILLAIEDVPGRSRWLGLALGQTGDAAGAETQLRQAVQTDPGDLELIASLASAEMQTGQVPDSLGGAADGALGELAGAAAWLRAQAELASHNPRGAATSFDRAAELFARCSPTARAGERVAAAYIGAAVSRLVAGDLDAAQRGFSSLPPRPADATRGLVDFARQLFASAEAVRDLSPDERAAALQPLVEVVTGARLRVAFYDGRLPVSMHWEHLI